MHKNIIIGGNLNVDFLSDKKQKIILTKMLTFNFHQIVNEATRVTNESSTCLDVVFINFRNKNNNVNVKEFGFSDLMGVLFTTPTNMQNLQQFITRKRIQNKANHAKFKKELQ